MGENQITRRRFLKYFGSASFSFMAPMLGAAGGVGRGCTPEDICAEDPLFPGDSSGPPVSISIVKNNDADYGVSRCIELIEGFDFLSPGDSVLIKPVCVCANPFPTTTSPDVVSRVIELLWSAGAGEIFLGEYAPAGGFDTIDHLQGCGIYQAAIDAGLDSEHIVVLDTAGWMSVEPANAPTWSGGFSIPAFFEEVDHIILLPTLRTHGEAEITMAMKSLVGIISTTDRSRLHDSLTFFQKIAEIQTGTDKIRLAILDARLGFSDKGPIEGPLISPGMIMASRHLALIDAVGVAVLRAMGTNFQLMNTMPWNQRTIRRGANVDEAIMHASGIDFFAEDVDILDRIRCQLVPDRGAF